MTQTHHSTPTTENRSDASRNGSNLSDRVRSLRLSDKTQSGGGSRGSAIPWTLCGVLVFMTAGFGYRAYMITPAPSEETAAANAPTSSSSTPGAASSSSTSGELALEVKGYVTPIHQIQVSPKVSGQLVWLHDKFEEGAYFQKDEVLALIEDVDYQTDYDHMKAMVASAEADLEEQKANMEQLRLNLRRTAQLATSSAAAASDYEVAKYGYDAMGRRVSKLEFSIEVAKADLVKAKWRLDNTKIKAPVSGTILTKKAELGNLVNPSAFSNGLSASLCDMANLAELEVEVKVSERDRPSVFKGQQCWVIPDAFVRDDDFKKAHPRGFEGVVSRIMPDADRANSAIPVRILITIPKGEEGVYLIPDMNATVSFLKKKAK